MKGSQSTSEPIFNIHSWTFTGRGTAWVVLRTVALHVAHASESPESLVHTDC